MLLLFNVLHLMSKEGWQCHRAELWERQGEVKKGGVGGNWGCVCAGFPDPRQLSSVSQS